jgi:hypothetical protein
LFGELRRHRFAIDRYQRVLRLAAEQLFADGLAQLNERPADGLLNQIPTRFFGMPLELGTHGTGPIADAGGLGSQPGIADHFLDIAQPIGPIAETVAGDGIYVAFGAARSTGELP